MTSHATAAKPTTPPRVSVTTSRLRTLLTIDAVGCTVLGLVALAGADRLEAMLGADPVVLVVAGAALLVYAVEAFLVARRPGRRGLLALTVMNGAFAIGAGVVALTAGLTTSGLVVAGALAAVSLVAVELLLIARRDTTTS